MERARTGMCNDLQMHMRKMYIGIKENVRVLKWTKELVRNKCDVYINTHAHVEDIGVSVKVRGVLMYLFNHSLNEGKLSLTALCNGLPSLD